MPIKADYHVHSNFSGDSTSTMESMIERAIELNLTRLCFTDHMDYDFPKRYGVTFEFDVKRYFDTIKELKEKYKSKIKILTGIELGLVPYLNERYETLVDFNDFDFVIGSSHLVDMYDPYYLEYWDRFSGDSREAEEKGFTRYFESILENLDAFDRFNVYGHLDYVVRYGPNKNKYYAYEWYNDIIDAILKKILDKGKGIEVNTAGFKYGLGNTHPHVDVLLRYLELGGELITIGSDAHYPEHLAYDFEKTCTVLKDLGFKYYAVFEQGKPIYENL